MILNLTQHPTTADQVEAGMIDLAGDELDALKDALTFANLPAAQEILDRAHNIAELACHNGLGPDNGDDPLPQRAMIGGALWLMAPLSAALRGRGIDPVFAFSVRETEEHAQADGSIRKVAVFRHAGFVPAIP